MWWLPQTSGTHIWESRWFESKYILYEKTRSTRHTLFTLDSHMVPDHTSPVVRVGNLSLVPTRMKHAPTPGRSLSDRRQTGSTVVLCHLIPPPSRQPWSRGEMFQPSGDISTSAYWAYNTSMQSIRLILARGANPSVLNRHRRGLQPWRRQLYTHHSSIFPIDGPPLCT
jgi:hypothetical protein